MSAYNFYTLLLPFYYLSLF